VDPNPDPDPHHFGDLDPHHFSNLDLHPHQIKSRIHIMVVSLMRICIRIRINVMPIPNTARCPVDLALLYPAKMTKITF
jgi:hypothetical protein